MATKLKLKHAPVYYTIAQVRHNPLLRLNAYVPEIQDKLRLSGFPDHQVLSLVVMAMDPSSSSQSAAVPIPKTIERHLFFNTNRNKGFIVDQDAFSFQSTEYETYTDFENDFITGLRIVHECVKLDFIERIGIRYLDAVVPKEGPNALPMYLVPGVLGLVGHLPPNVLVGSSFSQTQIPLDGMSLVSRTIVQHGNLGFPQDLEPQGLAIPERFRTVNGLHAILDNDASLTARLPMNIEDIQGKLDILHQKIRMTFDATITQHAMKVWQ